jgi:hypothetical protein
MMVLSHKQFMEIDKNHEKSARAAHLNYVTDK